MRRSPATQTAVLLNVADPKVESGQAEQEVLEHGPVPDGQDEAVPIDPVRVAGGESHELGEEEVSNPRRAHRGTGNAHSGMDHGIHTQSPQGGYALLLECRRGGVLVPQEGADAALPFCAPLQQRRPRGPRDPLPKNRCAHVADLLPTLLEPGKVDLVLRSSTLRYIGTPMACSSHFLRTISAPVSNGMLHCITIGALLLLGVALGQAPAPAPEGERGPHFISTLSINPWGEACG